MKKTYQIFTAHTRVGFYYLLIVFCCLQIGGYAQQRSRIIEPSNFSKIGYLEHLPSDYAKSNKQYPVLIFLHGAGERGNGTTDINKVRKNGPPKLIDQGHPMEFEVNGKKESFIVISPQLRADYGSWAYFITDIVIEHVKKNYRVDEDRIYLTGLSLGGGGVWSYPGRGSEYANKLAAIAPIAGHQSVLSGEPCTIAGAKLPVWAFHGDADGTTPLRYTTDWVSGINKCQKGLTKLTTYSGVGHSGAWVRAYNTKHTYHDLNLYEWLLLQKRGQAPVWSDSGADDNNQAPQADAGSDVKIDLSVGQVQLNGSGSSDPDGILESYAWHQSSGPTTAVLDKPSAERPKVSVKSSGRYAFTLEVSDEQGATSQDEVIITVSESKNSSSDCGCDHVITPAQPYVNGQSLGVKAGDVVCVEAGQYPYLNLFNFQGSASAPITIKNCGGQVKVGDSEVNYGIVMNNNKHIRLTGSGKANLEYGFKVDGKSRYIGSGFAIAGKSTHYEIDHLELTHVDAGVIAFTRPSCDASTWQDNFTMRNVSFHNLYIHDTKGEGFYIGNSALSTTVNCDGKSKEVKPHRIEYLKVYDNRLKNIGKDGIQIAQASKDCRVYNNTLLNYGTAKINSHQAGILMGGNTSGRVYNNMIRKGSGTGIQVFGTGKVTVYNNIVVDAGQDAIMCADRSPVAMQVRLVNNTLINAKDYGIRMYSDKSKGNVAMNNIVVSAQGRYSYKWNKQVELRESDNYYNKQASTLKFADIGENNYRLTGSSPVINGGGDASTYSVDKGYYGVSRPSSGRYDIGASEYDGKVVGNQLPVVSAGSDQRVNHTVNSVSFRATASDSDGQIVSYRWVQIKGDKLRLSNSASRDLTVSELKAGRYVFEVKVEDNRGGQAADEVSLEVVAAPTTGSGDQGLRYSYYEGDWLKLPDFGKLSAKKSGQVGDFNLDMRQRNDRFGVVFSGYIEVPVSGKYTFETISDDGSKLYIGGQGVNHLVVNNDGLHAKRSRTGTVALGKGRHPIRVTYFERAGQERLKVYWKGPQISRQLIPKNNLFLEGTEPVAAPAPTSSLSKTTYKINFTKKGVASGLSDWNDIGLNSASTSNTFEGLKDAEGNKSNISLTMYNGKQGSFVAGVVDNANNLSNGVYHDNILRYATYTSTRALFMINNLTASKTYDIHVYGGRTGAGERITEYLINGKSKKLQCMNNTSEVLIFRGVVPSKEGKVSLEFREGGDTWAYMNSIVIEVNDNESARTSEISKVGQSEEADSFEILDIEEEVRLFPNPVADNFTLSFEKSVLNTADIRIVDKVGKVVYHKRFIKADLEYNKLLFNASELKLRAGIYLLSTCLNNGTTRTVKLLVE